MALRFVDDFDHYVTADIDNGTDLPLSTSYLYYQTIYETKPGGGAWTTSDVNSSEFGVKVAA